MIHCRESLGMFGVLSAAIKPQSDEEGDAWRSSAAAIDEARLCPRLVSHAQPLVD